MKNNCWMDGVHGITECGIAPGESFTYRFEITQDPGTHWYHAHTGAQFADGLQGPIVILPREAPHKYVCEGNTDTSVMMQGKGKGIS
jgi:FtsP/CotA-like multicopper oxidase with cupredoxin domain